MIFWVIYHCDHHQFHHCCENKSYNIKIHKLDRIFISPFCYMSKHLGLSGYLTNICCDWLSLTNSMYSPQLLSNLTLRVIGNCSLLVLLYIILGKFLLQKNKQKMLKLTPPVILVAGIHNCPKGEKKEQHPVFSFDFYMCMHTKACTHEHVCTHKRTCTKVY